MPIFVNYRNSETVRAGRRPRDHQIRLSCFRDGKTSYLKEYQSFLFFKNDKLELRSPSFKDGAYEAKTSAHEPKGHTCSSNPGEYVAQ